MNRKVRGPKGQVFEHTLEEFVNVTKTDRVTSLINQIRSTEDLDERRRLKGQLPFRCPHYFRFRDNHRAQDAILPEEFTFQTCVDIDDPRQVETALARVHLLNEEEGGDWRGMLLHVEYSASKKLHIDIRIPVGKTIRETQWAYTDALGVDFDEDCCSPERMIYITDAASQLYTSEEWQKRLSDEEIALRRKAYEERGLDIDGRERKFAPSSENELKIQPVANDSKNASVNNDDTDDNGDIYPAEYNGIPYERIVEELADQMGGAPEHGNRNDFIFSMSCHLRHVCNDDPQWIRSILPDYGENHNRVTETIQNACKRKQSGLMTQKMKLTLDLCRRRMNMEQGFSRETAMKEPKMPKRLPAPIRLLISKVPEHCKPATAITAFTGLATHMGGVKLEYSDNTLMEATHMGVVVAPMSAGKSSIKGPLNAIMHDTEEHDKLAREREQQWKDSINSSSANKKKEARPDDLCIQVVDSDMTNAAFTQRLADAERAGNKALFTMMDEIEQLNKVAGNSRDVTRVICRNFDTDFYGQERVGAQSVTARSHMRWNWVASTTPTGLSRFFRGHAVDGTLSRIDLCTIIPPEDGEMPIYGRYDEKFTENLAPYLQLLEEAPRDTPLVCQQAKRMAKDLCKTGEERATLMGDDGYKSFSYRVAVTACRKGYMLYVMNGKKWSREIEDFCRWTFDYIMWCKMRYFGRTISEDFELERKIVSSGPVNMLDLLPESFSRDQLRSLRIQQGKDPDPQGQLKQWTHRKFIAKDESTGLYHKTEMYLSRQAA